MREHVIMDAEGMRRTFMRLAREIAESEGDLEKVVLLGIKRGGEIVARRMEACLSEAEGISVPCAGIDIGMERDDLVSSFFLPDYTKNKLGFSVEEKTVILCDDVLHTGRSARAGVETVFSLGRPKRVRLLELIDRGGRELPVRADYTGKNVPTAKEEYVDVRFTERGDAEDVIAIGRKEDADD